MVDDNNNTIIMNNMNEKAGKSWYFVEDLQCCKVERAWKMIVGSAVIIEDTECHSYF
jgi:hypothetical protein